MCDLDPIPDFDLSVNQSSKSITVTVEPGDKVHARWCYRKSAVGCMDGPLSSRITVSISGTFICMYALLFVHSKEIKHECFFALFRSIHLSRDQLFLTSLTCCPVSACRYFQLKIIFWYRQYKYFIESICFSCVYMCCLHWQVYYTHTDSSRHIKCPFKNQSLAGECDRWFMSESDWKQEHLVRTTHFRGIFLLCYHCFIVDNWDTLTHDWYKTECSS